MNKPLTIFAVRENIPYEGTNFWLVAANNEAEAKDLVNNDGQKVTWWNTDMDRVCTTTDFEEPQVIKTYL